MRLQRRRTRVAVVARPDEHVRGERREARGDLPDVQVVDLDDAGLAASARPTRLRVDAARARPRAARGPASRSSRQPERSISDGDEQRRDRVGAIEAGDEHDGAGGGRGQRRVEVGQHVLRERPRRSGCAARRSPSAAAAATLTTRRRRPTTSTKAPSTSGGATEPADGLDRDDAREHEQGRAVALGREDLGAPEPEREAPARRARREPRGARAPRAIAPASVSMCAASESSASESATMPTTTSTTMKARIERERDGQPAAVGRGGDGVGVVVVAVGHRGSG